MVNVIHTVTSSSIFRQSLEQVTRTLDDKRPVLVCVQVRLPFGYCHTSIILSGS